MNISGKLNRVDIRSRHFDFTSYDPKLFQSATSLLNNPAHGFKSLKISCEETGKKFDISLRNTALHLSSADIQSDEPVIVYAHVSPCLVFGTIITDSQHNFVGASIGHYSGQEYASNILSSYDEMSGITGQRQVFFSGWGQRSSRESLENVCGKLHSEFLKRDILLDLSWNMDNPYFIDPKTGFVVSEIGGIIDVDTPRRLRIAGFVINNQSWFGFSLVYTAESLRTADINLFFPDLGLLTPDPLQTP